MKNILVIGAGRSASSLITHLLSEAGKKQWTVTVADVSEELVLEKTKGHPASRPLAFDIHNKEQREKEIRNSDLVISMLPAFMHLEVALDCVRLARPLVTASYVSPEISALDKDAKKAGIILLNETGLDPGIDHMSAMQVIDSVKERGGIFTSFRSYCGGLVAPESNDNPWGYKFSWNPRNVILAGQGTAQYMENGSYKYIPYNRLFTQTEKVAVEGYGNFEAYANRDSLSYRRHYGLDSIPTMLRGTLRMPGYCNAWNVFVKLGWTDDTYRIADSAHLSYNQLLESFLPPAKGNLAERLIRFMGSELDEDSMEKIAWLDLFSDRCSGLENASPAMILQHLLEDKWRLKTGDKDMIVMQHRFCYSLDGEQQELISSLVVKGDDPVHTAMAKTVGLPVAIASGLILDGIIHSKGVCIPTGKEIYEPVLEALSGKGIRFTEKKIEVHG
ncbi:MAG: saccharopine dehydrogenase family protein [Bacteroidia bacterium]